MDILDEIEGREDFSWESLALCQNIVGPRKPNGDADDPLFDSYESSADTARAVDEMCSRCPVRKNCLLTGVEGKEQGVWGGFYLINGKPDRNRNQQKTPAQWAELRKLLS
jgi:hypothetical protein